MTTYEVRRELYHDGIDYRPGETIDASAFNEQADVLNALVAQGVLAIPAPPEKPPEKLPKKTAEPA